MGKNAQGLLFKKKTVQEKLNTINLVMVGLGPPVNEGSFGSSPAAASVEFRCVLLSEFSNSGKYRKWIPHLEAAVFTLGTS